MAAQGHSAGPGPGPLPLGLHPSMCSACALHGDCKCPPREKLGPHRERVHPLRVGFRASESLGLFHLLGSCLLCTQRRLCSCRFALVGRLLLATLGAPPRHRALTTHMARLHPGPWQPGEAWPSRDHAKQMG